MAMKHNLTFSVFIKKFGTKDDVIRFIIIGILNRLHMTLFQKGELVLANQDALVKKGKENMKLGGKGSKIHEKDKVDTMVQLADLIGSSHDTLRKTRYILNVLRDEDLLAKLRSGDISINKVHDELTGKKKVIAIVEENRKNEFPDFRGHDETINSTKNLSIEVEIPALPKFHIDEYKKYQVIYIKPTWNVSNMIILPDLFLEELQKMNISEIIHDKFCTLFIQAPSKYLAEALRIIESWKFVCVDSLCVSGSSSAYSSNYSDQNHEFLLVCEFNGVGVPKSLISNRSTNSIIPADNVRETLRNMFDNNISKLSIFSEPIDGWDSYSYNNEAKMMNNSKKSAA